MYLTGHARQVQATQRWNPPFYHLVPFVWEMNLEVAYTVPKCSPDGWRKVASLLRWKTAVVFVFYPILWRRRRRRPFPSGMFTFKRKGQNRGIRLKKKSIVHFSLFIFIEKVFISYSFFVLFLLVKAWPKLVMAKPWRNWLATSCIYSKSDWRFNSWRHGR